MRDWDPTISRSVILADRISRRTDEAVRVIVHQFERDLCFQPIEDHMISQAAWGHVASAGYEPHHVFAHHEMLIDVPHVSAYYRNMAMLPLKRVSDLAVGVERWEDLESESRITVDRAKKVARLYNAVNSSIIEGKTDWTLQNGYRNMIANMGIGLDGTMRNIIGRDADMLLKTRMLEWLESHALIVQGDPFKGGVGLVGGAIRCAMAPNPILSSRRGRTSSRQSRLRVVATPQEHLNDWEQRGKVLTQRLLAALIS